MKKSLLLAFALACVMTGNAQSVSKGAMVYRNDVPDMPRQKMMMANGPRKVKKSVDNGLYYTIPGAMYGGWTVDGMGYAYSMAMVPPFTDVTFANQATDKFACNWFINGNDITEYAEENGDYVSNYGPNGWYYTPALQHRKIEGGYQYNEDNYWVQTGQYEVNDISLSCTYSPELMMTPVDNHGHRTSNGNVYRNSLAGYGFLSTSFLFGTGQVDLEDDGVYDFTAYGFEQTYNPLLAPMYVDEIHINAVTLNNYGPIPAGKSVKAYIIALDEEGAAKELLATFEATASDTLDFQDKDDDWQGQTAYFGSIVYRNTETFTDIFGNQTSLPAAIPAGVPFRIQFEGMDEEGVSIGAYALWKSDVEDTYIENGYLLMKEGRAFTFQSPLAASIDILGQYEVIDVQTKDFLSSESQEDFPAADFQGWNVLRVAAEGTTETDNGLVGISTEGLVGNEKYDLGWALVGTSVDWYDEEGLPNYDVDEELLPDWVEEILVDTTYYNSDGLTGYNFVTFKCKPLPEGVTGRSCKLDIFGNAGIAGNNPIIILQGDATLADGIAEVKSDKKVIRKRGLYNLNGQRIATPVDGQLYIKDGKKFLMRKK